MLCRYWPVNRTTVADANGAWSIADYVHVDINLDISVCPSLAVRARTLATRANSGLRPLRLAPALWRGIGPAPKRPEERVRVFEAKKKADFGRTQVRILQVMLG